MPRKEKSKPVLRFAYLCPACTAHAIETTDKMLGVEVDCDNCGKRIPLNDKKRYIKIK